MSLTKTAGLAAIALLAMMAMFGASSALANGSTQLCKADPLNEAGEKCPAGSAVTEVHFVDPLALLFAEGLFGITKDILCTVLFQSLAAPNGVLGSGQPQIIHGGFTFFAPHGSPGSPCFEMEEEENCGTIQEIGGHGLLLVLRTAKEEAKITGEGFEVLLECGGLHCVYDATNLVSTGLGALIASSGLGESHITNQTVNKVSGFLCPNTAKLTTLPVSLAALYIGTGSTSPPPHTTTALCKTDEKVETCFEENKPSSVEFKDSAVEFLTNLLNFKCEGTLTGSTIGAAAKPQEVSGAKFKYTGCTNSCVVTEVSGSSKLLFLRESSELASVTNEGLELFLKCGETIKCLFAPAKVIGHGLGALSTSDNGHLTFSKVSLEKGEGTPCPSEAKLDALFIASSATYIRTEYVKPNTALCSKDEGNPECKSENRLKTIDWKDAAVELLTNLINVKCEGLVSGTVGEPANPLTVKATVEYSCSGGCVVTDVSGGGTISLQRTGTEAATATSEGFELFVKCGTTIKCLIGPEKMVGQALGALKTGDNGHLTFTKVSLGKGEGATCPSEATLDALYVASSATYIG